MHESKRRKIHPLKLRPGKCKLFEKKLFLFCSNTYQSIIYRPETVFKHLALEISKFSELTAAWCFNAVLNSHKLYSSLLKALHGLRIRIHVDKYHNVVKNQTNIKEMSENSQGK